MFWNRSRVTGTLKVMSRNGDDVFTWNKNDTKSTEKVRQEFNRIMFENKMLAYTVPARGQAEVIRKFDPEATLIHMHQQNRGG